MMKQQQKYTYPENMVRERNNRSWGGGENETSHQIKQLLTNSEKIEKKEKTKQKKKQGAAVAFLNGNKKKTAREPRCPLYFRSADHRLHFPML